VRRNVTFATAEHAHFRDVSFRVVFLFLTGANLAPSAIRRGFSCCLWRDPGESRDGGQASR
jgi:hypothetical protein